MTRRPGSRRGRLRFVMAMAILAAGFTAAGLLTAARWYGAAAVWAVSGLVWSRMCRRWPWTARWLFRREITRTRHAGGETRFAYPFIAPLQRRRRIPREPKMRQRTPGG